MDGSHDVGEIQLLAKSLFAGIYNWGRFLFIAILGRFLIKLSQNIIFPTLVVTDLSFLEFFYIKLGTDLNASFLCFCRREKRGKDI